MLANVEQRGDDTHADLMVRREWIAEQRRIPIELSPDRKIEVSLHPVMVAGTTLRLKGQALPGTGDLLLRIRVLE